MPRILISSLFSNISQNFVKSILCKKNLLSTYFGKNSNRDYSHTGILPHTATFRENFHSQKALLAICQRITKIERNGILNVVFQRQKQFSKFSVPFEYIYTAHVNSPFAYIDLDFISCRKQQLFVDFYGRVSLERYLNFTGTIIRLFCFHDHCHSLLKLLYEFRVTDLIQSDKGSTVSRRRNLPALTS